MDWKEEHMDDKERGKRIQQLRQEMNLSQEQLVEKLNVKVTIHSGNMYQIFTYVKNQDVENNGRVSGMLLYAKTEEAITPDCSFVIGGNKISVKTVDLNKEFKLIAAQLDKIAEDYFGKKRIEDSII